MAVYKVPQDVEAEDKLLGPFSFRQFIYLIIAVIAGAIAWGLAQISIFLIAIPLPVIIAFGALALPLKKDQPMETYLAALVQFFLKPKKRMWDPDGTMSLVQITAPRRIEEQRTKGISENEAVNRLSYLAQLMDTRGWASRGVGDAAGNSSLVEDIALEAEEATDMMDETAGVSQSFNSLIEQSDAARKEEMRARMQQVSREAQQQPAVPGNPYDQFTAGKTTGATQAAPAQTSQQPNTPAPAADEPGAIPQFNPYPTIHQHVVQPLGTAPAAPPKSAEPAAPSQPQPAAPPSEEQLSPDIMKLATNPDLSISTIAHEAHRLQEKQNGEEVVISLR
ncbi:MAG TPA: PrgI family protein [Verrucomicrobiae bacterium]|nr:PrgI family protein [Verrucomicrobiae bacterium]